MLTIEKQLAKVDSDNIDDETKKIFEKYNRFMACMLEKKEMVIIAFSQSIKFVQNQLTIFLKSFLFNLCKVVTTAKEKKNTIIKITRKLNVKLKLSY